MLHQDWVHDLELVRAVDRGDEAARLAFCERMESVPRFLAALNARAGSPIAADDLLDHVQEIHLSVWRNLAKFAGRSRLESWVFGFCRNQLREAIRRQRTAKGEREAAAKEAARGAWEELLVRPALPAASEALSEFCRYLKHLSGNQARVIEMMYLEGRTYAEIAAALDVKESTIKKHHSRALAKLEDVLRPTAAHEEAE